MQAEVEMTRWALISECTKFRYLLLRQWDAALPLLLFVMLNPSTADGRFDDATIKRCIAFAMAMGFGGFYVANLYAYRTPKPEELRKAHYPIGPDNDKHMAWALTKVREVCVAWGGDAKGLSRPADVLKLIRAAGHQPKALALTGDGIPRHPLYLPASSRLQPIPQAA